MTATAAHPSRTGLRITLAIAFMAITAMALSVVSPISEASQQPPENRHSLAPNVIFPVAGGKAKDSQSWRGRDVGEIGTRILSPCGSVVRASHPGIAKVINNGRVKTVRITAASNLTTFYRFTGRIDVVNGQLMQSAQPIGTIAKRGATCNLLFAVLGSNNARRHPSRWLDQHVGSRTPVNLMFGNRGFRVASLNVLDHRPGTDWGHKPTEWRMKNLVQSLDDFKIDVVGLQEVYHAVNKPHIMKYAAPEKWAMFPGRAAPRRNTNRGYLTLMWRKSEFAFVEAHYLAVPRHKGIIVEMPVVKLRHRKSGRQAWFINVHNAASCCGWGDQAHNRRKAEQIERNEMVRLRREQKAVFLMGDFNDRKPTFCKMTQGKLAITPNSVPNFACSPPPRLHIDMIFAAGQARFLQYETDWSVAQKGYTDHPIVWAEAFLAP